MIHFDRRIRTLRVVLLGTKRSLRDIAEHVGCSASQLSLISNGLADPTPSVRERLSAYFNTDEERLFAPLASSLPWLSETE